MATALTHTVSREHVDRIAEWFRARGVDQPERTARALTESAEFQSVMQHLASAAWVDGATSGMDPADLER